MQKILSIEMPVLGNPNCQYRYEIKKNNTWEKDLMNLSKWVGIYEYRIINLYLGKGKIKWEHIKASSSDCSSIISLRKKLGWILLGWEARWQEKKDKPWDHHGFGQKKPQCVREMWMVNLSKHLLWMFVFLLLIFLHVNVYKFTGHKA